MATSSPWDIECYLMTVSTSLHFSGFPNLPGRTASPISYFRVARHPGMTAQCLRTWQPYRRRFRAALRTVSHSRPNKASFPAQKFPPWRSSPDSQVSLYSRELLPRRSCVVFPGWLQKLPTRSVQTFRPPWSALLPIVAPLY